jgi:hypothetical protein
MAYANKPNCTFDKNFSLRPDGICPRCNNPGLFFTASSGKPFEKCETCLVMFGSKRPAGYQPQIQPEPQPAHNQATRNVFNKPAGGSYQPPPPQQQQQYAAAPLPNQVQGVGYAVQPNDQPFPYDKITELLSEVSNSVNHLTNALYEMNANNEKLTTAFLQALDTLVEKLNEGQVQAAYNEMNVQQ